MNQNEIKTTILSHLETSWQFYECVAAAKDLNMPEYEASGFLRVLFKLSDCREWIGGNENDDKAILAVLDQLSAQRKLKVFMCCASRNIHWNDILFRAEVGRAVRQLKRFGCDYEYDPLIFYFDSPMTKAEYLQGGCTIERPSEAVKKIRDRRDRHFGKQFGTRDLELERRLDREAREDDARLSAAIMTIARDIKERKGEQV